MEPENPVTPRRGNLVYCVFGAELYLLEARFSILSALKYLEAGSDDVGIIVCTTRPDLFEGYPVTIEPITDAILDEWKGPDRYFYRFQIQVLRYVMDRHPATAILVDSDTCFIQPPQRVFDFVGPGRSTMHQNEGLLFGHPAHAKIAAQLIEGYPDLVVPLGGGGTLTLARETTEMWNAGVVGVDIADRPILDRALELCDAVFHRTKIFNAVQFSLGEILRRGTKLTQAETVIYHYWPDWVDPYLNTSVRRLMHAQIRELFRSTENQGFEALLDHARRLEVQRLERPLPVKILAKFLPPAVVTRIYPVKWAEAKAH